MNENEWIGVVLVGILLVVYLISSGKGGGTRRVADYSDYIDVVDNDSKLDEKVLMAAAGLVEERRNGRHLGGPVRVNWDVSKHYHSPEVSYGDYDTAIHAAWAEEEGPKCNVFVNRVGEVREHN